MRIDKAVLVLAGAWGAMAAADEKSEIETPDCFRHVAMVRAELELIRLEMGKPLATGTSLEIVGAQPREVFYQALTLFKKTDRLCFEIARVSAPPPIAPTGVIRPRHVFEVISSALDRIRLVKKKLGISEQIAEIAREVDKQPGDVFRSVVEADRQLRLLLDAPFSPSDVFQQMTLALHHATLLRAHFPGKRMPDKPPFVRRKMPMDVYRRLVECYDLIHEIAGASGFALATLKAGDGDDASIAPSDVYDVASLVVSELAHLHVMLTGEKPPDDSYPPGRKFPSHVFQRAGVLKSQLEELVQLVRDNPSWLREASHAK